LSFLSVTANGGNTTAWRLKHKDVDYKFNQQMNKGGKSLNTGVFKWKLETLSNGKFFCEEMQMLLQELSSFSPDMLDMVHFMSMCQWSILNSFLLRKT